jgi:hypothetical protein
MKDQKNSEDLMIKYEQLRLRSKQRLIGGIIILLFALFLLLYVVAKIKPLSSHATIIMKTKASDTEQLAIKQIVGNSNIVSKKDVSKKDVSTTMIQVVDNNQKNDTNADWQSDTNNKAKQEVKKNTKQLNPEAILNGHG